MHETNVCSTITAPQKFHPTRKTALELDSNREWEKLCWIIRHTHQASFSLLPLIPHHFAPPCACACVHKTHFIYAARSTNRASVDAILWKRMRLVRVICVSRTNSISCAPNPICSPVGDLLLLLYISTLSSSLNEPSGRDVNLLSGREGVLAATKLIYRHRHIEWMYVVWVWLEVCWCWSRDVLFAGHYGYYSAPPCNNIYSYVSHFRVFFYFIVLIWIYIRCCAPLAIHRKWNLLLDEMKRKQNMKTPYKTERRKQVPSYTLYLFFFFSYFSISSVYYSHNFIV